MYKQVIAKGILTHLQSCHGNYEEESTMCTQFCITERRNVWSIKKITPLKVF